MSSNWSAFFDGLRLRGVSGVGLIPSPLRVLMAEAAEQWEQGKVWSEEQEEYVPIPPDMTSPSTNPPQPYPYGNTPTQSPDPSQYHITTDMSGQVTVVHRPTGRTMVGDDAVALMHQLHSEVSDGL